MMPQLAKRHTVVAVDLRGAGHSEKPQGGFDKHSMASDIYAVVTTLGFTKYAVCDHDIEAMMALALALTQRDAVTHLAVLDTSQPGWSRWVHNSHEQKVWHIAFHMKRDLPELLIQGREREYVSAFIYERAFDHGAHSVDEIDTFARAGTAGKPERRSGMVPRLSARSREWPCLERRAALHSCAGAWGRAFVRFSDWPMLEAFASNVRSGSVSGCGHWLPEE